MISLHNKFQQIGIVHEICEDRKVCTLRYDGGYDARYEGRYEARYVARQVDMA